MRAMRGAVGMHWTIGPFKSIGGCATAEWYWFLCTAIEFVGAAYIGSLVECVCVLRIAMCDSIFSEFIWCNFGCCCCFVRGKIEHRTTYKLNHIHFIAHKGHKTSGRKKKNKNQKNVNKKNVEKKQTNNGAWTWTLSVCRPQSDEPTRNVHNIVMLVGIYASVHIETQSSMRAYGSQNGPTQELNRRENIERQKIIIKQISIEKLCIKW